MNKFLLIIFIIAVNVAMAKESRSIQRVFKKDEHVAVFMEINRKKKIYFLVNEKIENSVNDHVRASLQSQASVLEVNAKGQWTKMMVKPFLLNYALSGKKLVFEQLNQLILVERDLLAVRYSVKDGSLNAVDKEIMDSFFSPLPSDNGVFELPESFSKEDVWNLDSKKLANYFNTNQTLLKVSDDQALGKMAVKEETEMLHTIEGTTVYRKLNPIDKRLEDLKPKASVASMKMIVELPKPGKVAPYSSNSLTNIAYIGEKIQDDVKIELSITIQDQSIKLIKEIKK